MGDKLICISVRDLAEDFPPVGSIDHREGLHADPTLGIEIHQAVQKERSAGSSGYRAEVPLSHIFAFEKWSIEVSGRVDGVETVSDAVVCEEIKTSVSPRRLLRAIERNQTHPYVMQAHLYAHLYMLQFGRPAQARLLIVSASERTVEAWEGNLSPEEIEQWLQKRFESLVAQEKVRKKFLADRRKMAKAIKFPFASPRAGQEELSSAVATAVQKRSRFMVQAPTGLGKSIGVLFPALKDALQRGAKVIYATPKNSQHGVAENACEQWRAMGLKISSLTLNARAKVCMKEEQACNPDYCEFARSHFDKVNEAGLLAKLAKKTVIDAAILRRFAQKYEVCPYELGLQALPGVDVVIADYNYVFSPVGSIVERCHSGVIEKPKMNVVVDEAHNLYSRALEYFSPALATSMMAHALKDLHALPETLQASAASVLEQAESLIKSFANTGRLSEHASRGKSTCVVTPLLQPFLDIQGQLSRLTSECTELADKQLFSDGENPLLPVLWQWSAFTDQLMTATEAWFCTFSRNDDDEILQLHCCNASDFLSNRMKQFNATIAFSATLKPFNFYASLSGFDLSRDKALEFGSPFPRENRKILVIPQVSTAWEKRSANYVKIAEALRKIIQTKSGNYFVFFPSFEFLREIDGRLTIEGFDIERQLPGTGNDEARRLLKSFRKRQNMVVLAVQGGVYAEGVDLPGDQLIGSLIVGPAVPPFSVVREQMRRYYQKAFGAGFDYAYTFPAMSRVVQAAGRVIRTDSDRGVIVLLDQRFIEPQYAGCMPSDWFDRSVGELVSQSILADLREFWQSGSDYCMHMKADFAGGLPARLK